MTTATQRNTGGRTKSRVAAASLFMLAFILYAATGFAQPFQDPVQGLARVGPVTQTHGYPDWYQDKTGITLEFCGLKSQAELDGGYCLLLPGDTTYPETFPGPFADEHFYWAADAAVGDARLVLGLEAAFSLGPVKAGDQVVFGRLRIRYDAVPTAGTYTIYTPYGKFVFPNVSAGADIRATFDIGFACPAGQFDCALGSHVGPFLLASTDPGGTELPPHSFEGRRYIASPARSGPVTGSPLGPFTGADGVSRNHNIFRIEVTDAAGTLVTAQETYNFSLMGRLWEGPVPGEVTESRATYTVTGQTAKLDVFATAFGPITPRIPGGAIQPPAPPVMAFYAAPCGGPEGGPYTAPAAQTQYPMANAGSRPYFWAQLTALPSLPTHVCLEDSTARNAQGQTVPTFSNLPITDQVTITQANYDPAARTLTVRASSSDPSASLTVVEFNGVLTGGVFTAQALDAPPSRISVNSLYGGSAEFLVTTGVGSVEPPPTCTFTISPMTLDLPAAGGSGQLTVNASATTCAWTASSDAAWLTVNPTSGTGSGSTQYTAAANTSSIARSAVITIAGQQVLVQQAAAPVAPVCTFTLSPTFAEFGPDPAPSNTLTVTASDPSCTWTAVSNSAFIPSANLSPASGTGSGTVTYRVVAYSGTTARWGTMTIAGQTFTVVQKALPVPVAGCETLTLTPTWAPYSSARAVANTLAVTAPDTCTWTAVSNTQFVSVPAGSGGTGNGTVTYTVAANANTTPRTGTINIGGFTFLVAQEAAVAPPPVCNFTLDPTGPFNVGASGGNGTITVTATDPSCTWTAASDGAWLSVTPASGTGTGSVQYTAAANTAFTARSATLTIAGLTVAVNQAAAQQPPVANADNPPAFNEDAPAQTFNVLANDTLNAPAGATIVVTLVSSPGLASAVVNSDNTITYTPNLNANGTDTFQYRVSVNGVLSNNPALVTVVINPVNDAPVAVADGPLAVTANTPFALTLIGNDTDVDNAVQGVTELSLVTGPGTATGNATVSGGAGGTVSFTANQAGTYTFTYRAVDALGLASLNVATVTVDVTAGTETITITQADYRPRQDRWIVAGSSNVRNNQILRITYSEPGSAQDGLLIGTAQVASATGTFALDARGTGIVAGVNGRVRVENVATGAVEFRTVNIR